MPLNRKRAEILESMREHYGPTKGTQVFHASRNKGTIRGVEQSYHKPVTNSPHNALRPPSQAANAPMGRRMPSSAPHLGVPGSEMHGPMRAKQLAGEVASGLRQFSFADVRRNQGKR